MNNLLKIVRHKHFILSVFACIWYFFIFFQLSIPVSEEIMFASSDSLSYLSVGDWMFGGEPTMFVEHRPFLFPLFVSSLNNIGGVQLIWFIQFVFWLVSVNFLFSAIHKLTNKVSLSILGAAVLMFNLTLIALTLHALTEVMNVFLLTALLFYFSKNLSKRKSPQFILSILFLFVLLILVKPVYTVPTAIILFGVIPIFYGRVFLKNPKKIFLLLIVLSPLFIQLGIMKWNYNSYSISNISGRTFERYLLAQGIGEINQIEREAALTIASSMSSSEQKEFFKENVGIYTNLFLNNIEKNIKASSTFLRFPVGYSNPQMGKFMEWVNSVYWHLHLVFMPLSILLGLYLLFKKHYLTFLVIASFVGLAFYYVFVTGISFSQGDRLVLGALPLWICGYIVVGITLVTVIKSGKTSFLRNNDGDS